MSQSRLLQVPLLAALTVLAGCDRDDVVLSPERSPAVAPVASQNSVIAVDAFTEDDPPQNIDLTGHVPDLGFGGWTYNRNGEAAIPGQVHIEFGDRAANQVQGPLRSRSTNDITNDNFQAWIWARRSAVGSDQRVGLRFRVDRRPDPDTEAEGVDVYLKAVSGTRMALILEHRVTDPVTGVTTVYDTTFTDTIHMPLSIFPAPPSSGRRLGVDVNGLDVTVWTGANNDADPVTVDRHDYGPYTLRADTRDDDHKRMGNYWNSSFPTSSSRMWVMHYHVESFEPPPPPIPQVEVTTIRDRRSPAGLPFVCQSGGGDFRVSVQALFPNGSAAGNLPVTLMSRYVLGSGGHAHQTIDRPGFGTFDQAAGMTDPFGKFSALYTPGSVGALEEIVATVEGPEGPGVGLKTLTIAVNADLVELTDDNRIDVIGGPPEHPERAFIHPRAEDELLKLGDGFVRASGGVTMPVGDASLELGGLFDLDGAFLAQDPDAGHSRHGCGIEVDVPAILTGGGLALAADELVEAAARAPQLDIAYYAEHPGTGATHVAFDRTFHTGFPVFWPEGDKLTVDARVVSGSIDPATQELELEYELTNAPTSEQSLRVFMVGTSLESDLIPPALGWVTYGPTGSANPKLDSRAFFGAGPAGEDVPPGGSRRGFKIRTQDALPAIDEFWAEGRYATPVEATNEEGKTLKAALVEANAFEGLIVAPREVGDPDPAIQINGLLGWTRAACVKGWIDSAGVCRNLESRLELAARFLAMGRDQLALRQIGLVRRQLAKQRGRSVNENAFWLLDLRAQFVEAGL